MLASTTVMQLMLAANLTMTTGINVKWPRHTSAGLIPRMRPNFDMISILLSLCHGRVPGAKSRAVEALIASRIGVRHVVLTPSGRGGFYLLLHSLPEGQVCLPGYTCSAVAEAAQLAGRRTRYLDHIHGSTNLTPEDIAGRLQPGDIFVLTHQYGYATEADRLAMCAREQGCIVVEDIAAAFGGSSGGKSLGSFGTAAFGSFDVSKLVNVPLKGGFVATDDDQLAKALRARAKLLFRRMSLTHTLKLALQGCLLRLVTKPGFYRSFHTINFGLRGRTTAEDGTLADRANAFYTTEFSEWQAAIALPQLEQLDETIRRRSATHLMLRAKCATTSSLRSEATPPEIPGACARFPIYTDADKFKLYQRFLDHGVDCGFSFTTLATPRAFAESWKIADSVLNLPFYTEMGSLELEMLTTALDALGGQKDVGTIP